ncbi:MAG TPA: DNA-directed RNA polymerase subunit B'' [Candidatus Nanoarchaeia archaeon]|nr:DNA-directed RNA polymerase subunit B'' [Candidatus Nanoarchaeia archaeon]
MDRTILLKKYFEGHQFVESNIQSFNTFIERGMQEVVDENKEAEPTIIPDNIDRFVIKFGKIWVGKPEIIEADGSKRNIYPVEARLRKISYSAPIFLEVSAHINDVQRESFTAQIGKMPIMLKSKYCHLTGLNKEDLTKHGEDPYDPGGYFIINGTEKVLITVEDLAPNNFIVDKDGDQFVGKIFSERGSYKIPHTLEKSKSGVYFLTFTRVKKAPIVLVLKALGLSKDEDIMKAVSPEQVPDVLVNLYEFIDIKTQEEAIDELAKLVGITQVKEIRQERVREILNKYLLPNLAIENEHLLYKAYNLCKMWKQLIDVSTGRLSIDDKDHYNNKKLKLAGDLLLDLFRVNFKVLVGDLLYNFQRIIKRGKLPSIKVIIREKLLTSRIYSAMATGTWVGGRKGISQRMDRANFVASMSHLQRVVSPLSASQENFEARALHSTHLGRLCPIETPEGTNIGLRKNLALLCSISHESSEQEVITMLKKFGLESVQ